LYGVTGCGKTIVARWKFNGRTSRTTGEHHAGCSKSLSSKAAASDHLLPLLRGGWDDPNCAHYSTHPALSAPRRALSRARAFQFSLPLFRGVAKAALDCAHRTSTDSPCAFCEQGGHLATPASSFGGRALREHGDRPSYPTSFFSILLMKEGRT
jgi:hypothetical protein